MQQCFGGMQRNEVKERMGKKKKKKKKCKDCSTKTNRLNIANKFIYSFLERSSDECVGHVIQFISNCQTELESYSKPCQTSKIEFSAKIVNGSKLLTICTKCSSLIVWLGSEYAPENSVAKSVFSNDFQIFLFLISRQVRQIFCL